jgi:hypothetical protein
MHILQTEQPAQAFDYDQVENSDSLPQNLIYAPKSIEVLIKGNSGTIQENVQYAIDKTTGRIFVIGDSFQHSAAGSENGQRKIALRSFHGRYFCGGEEDGHVIADRPQRLAWEEWLLVPLGDNKVALRAANGKWLCSEQNGNVVANRAKQDAWETWFMETLSNGKVALKSFHGKWLCSESDGKVVANREHLREWETWTLEYI